MRILHLSHPGRPLYELEWFHRAAGGRLTTVVPECAPHPDSGTVIGLPVSSSRMYGMLGSTAHPARYVGLQDRGRFSDFDAVISLELFSSTTAQAIDVACSAGRPLVIIVYELIRTHPIYWIPPFRRITKRSTSAANRVVCVTRAAADHAISLGAPPGAVEVVHPGVDTDIFHPSDVSEQEPGIIFVGHLSPHKGLPELLVAYEELVRLRPDVRLTVIGDGPLRERVIEVAHQLPNVGYLGSLPQSAVADQLRRHTIFAAPATDTYRVGVKIGAEQFGFGIVEAMASGLAVVGTACGAIPEILPPGNPVVPQHDVPALVMALDQLVCDDQEATALGASNRSAARTKFSLSGQAARLAAILSSS